MHPKLIFRIIFLIITNSVKCEIISTKDPNLIELMNLDTVFASLNMTYQQLGVNASEINNNTNIASNSSIIDRNIEIKADSAKSSNLSNNKIEIDTHSISNSGSKSVQQSYNLSLNATPQLKVDHKASELRINNQNISSNTLVDRQLVGSNQSIKSEVAHIQQQKRVQNSILNKSNTNMAIINSFDQSSNIGSNVVLNIPNYKSNQKRQQDRDHTIYKITQNYKIFVEWFIVSSNDSNLKYIKDYLIINYGNYLENGNIIAGFRSYNLDYSLDYQLLYSTIYGTFTAVLTYWPDYNSLQLKSLSILNTAIMQIDYSNCYQANFKQKNCQVCRSGYRNFLGKCLRLDKDCKYYITDQCGQCKSKQILFGNCQ